MLRRKYAVRFPEMQTANLFRPIDDFSERSVQTVERNCFSVFDCFHSLANYIIERNRTVELKKRIAADKQALDVKVREAIEQERIAFVEYTKQLQIKLRTAREEMELAAEKYAIEISQRVSALALEAERVSRENEYCMTVIRDQRTVLDCIQSYLKQAEADYAQRKEYIMLCDAQRKALENIDVFMKNLLK